MNNAGLPFPLLSSGLTLKLFLDAGEYMHAIAVGIGAVLVIHPVGQQPFPEDHATYIGPGQATSVGIVLVRFCLHLRLCFYWYCDFCVRLRRTQVLTLGILGLTNAEHFN